MERCSAWNVVPFETPPREGCAAPGGGAGARGGAVRAPGGGAGAKVGCGRQGACQAAGPDWPLGQIGNVAPGPSTRNIVIGYCISSGGSKRGGHRNEEAGRTQEQRKQREEDTEMNRTDTGRRGERRRLCRQATSSSQPPRWPWFLEDLGGQEQKVASPFQIPQKLRRLHGTTQSWHKEEPSKNPWRIHYVAVVVVGRGVGGLVGLVVASRPPTALLPLPLRSATHPPSASAYRPPTALPPLPLPLCYPPTLCFRLPPADRSATNRRSEPADGRLLVS